MRPVLLALAALALAVPAADAAKKRPNLEVTAVSAVQAGPTVDVADTTRNAGRRRAKKSRTSYALVSEATGAVTSLGSRPIKRLRTRKRSRGSRAVVLPPVAAGGYDVRACADATAKVRESEERDNCRTTAGTLVTVAAVSPTPTPTPAPTPTATPEPSPAPSPDADADGVPDAADNCVDWANPGQENGDGDAVGDACDCAPEDASEPPGADPYDCAVTLTPKDLNFGFVSPGATVRVRNLVVHALATTPGGAWARSDDPEPDHSAIELTGVDRPAGVGVGSRIDVRGTAAFGLGEVVAEQYTVVGEGASHPVVATTVDELVPDGFAAIHREVVSLQDLRVTEVLSDGTVLVEDATRDAVFLGRRAFAFAPPGDGACLAEVRGVYERVHGDTGGPEATTYVHPRAASEIVQEDCPS